MAAPKIHWLTVGDEDSETVPEEHEDVQDALSFIQSVVEQGGDTPKLYRQIPVVVKREVTVGLRKRKNRRKMSGKA